MVVKLTLDELCKITSELECMLDHLILHQNNLCELSLLILDDFCFAFTNFKEHCGAENALAEFKKLTSQHIYGFGELLGFHTALTRVFKIQDWDI